MITAGLPGAQTGFALEDFRAAVSKYKGMSEKNLREHIAYFLDHTVPVAKASGVRLCCHSDDPAFTPFLGTPRSVGSSEGYKFLLDHGCGANLILGLFEMAEIIKTTRFRVVEAAIKVSGGSMDLKDEALDDAHQAEIDKIGRKIAFIKIPFATGEQGICAQLR